jgi:GST-like protein
VIDLYAWGTPNNHRISVMLEELGLEYRVFPKNIREKEHSCPEVLSVNPMGKIPVIIDRDPGLSRPVELFESGAILIYLAEKTGRFLPTEFHARLEVIKWLIFILTQLGSRINVSHHYRHFAPERFPHSIEHHDGETKRVFNALNRHLEGVNYLAGDYSIADIACYPWIWRHYWAEIDLSDHPNLKRWYELVGCRPGVKRGMRVMEGAVD